MPRPPRITREQLLGAARTAFSARGFAATTLADIARELDVTPAAILRHFSSKQELFNAAMSNRGIATPEFITALAKLDASADPRVVLAELARRMIPFLGSVIRPAIAVQMHTTTLVVPFDPKDDEIPPRRAIRILTDYFARAIRAGVIREADPRALALLFIGQLQAYVFFHQVLGVAPAHPVEDYIDALLGLWSEGVFAGGARARKKTSAEDRAAARARGGGSRGAAVLAQAERTETARPRRNPGGADGERGVARGRTRGPRTRR
jgi:AcrR family transcriptional regulator